MRATCLFFFAFLFSPFSFSKPTNKMIDWHDRWFVLGTDFGSLEKKSVKSPEIENDGSVMSLHGSISEYKKQWVGDLGFGIRFDNMESSGLKVETKSFQAGFGYRYRINEAFSIGPQLHFLMGQDVSFSDTGTNSDDKKLSVFGGARAIYDWRNLDENNQQHMWRAGFGLMTDLGLGDRQVNYLHLSIEYAWPVRKAQKIVGLEKESFISFNMKAAKMSFISGSAELEPTAIERLKKLSKVLERFNHEWDYVDIDGHTDITGDYKNNIKLSWTRAESVKSILKAEKIDPLKVNTTGHGPDKPLTKELSPEALAKNRRVEIGIVGDSASKDFIAELNEVLELEKAP